MYKSIYHKEYHNAIACALDNEGDKERFEALYLLMKKHYPSALDEWKVSHNFNDFTDAEVIKTLLDICIIEDNGYKEQKRTIRYAGHELTYVKTYDEKDYFLGDCLNVMQNLIDINKENNILSCFIHKGDGLHDLYEKELTDEEAEQMNL